MLLDLIYYSLLQVFDVTKFLDDHPGGDEVLLSATGKLEPATHWTYVLYLHHLSEVLIVTQNNSLYTDLQGRMLQMTLRMLVTVPVLKL